MTYRSYASSPSRRVRRDSPSPLRAALLPLLLIFCALIPLGFARYAWEHSQVSRVLGAAKSGNLQTLKAAITANPRMLNVKGYLGRTPLYWAAAKGRVATIDFLVEKKAKINLADARGWTPLHAAAAHNQADAVRTLLDAGANKAAVDREGGTALHAAATGFNIGSGAVLIDQGFDVDAKDRGGYTPLHIAARRKQLNMAVLLTDRGASVSAKAKDGTTPLRAAHETVNNDDMIDLLQERGAQE